MGAELHDWSGEDQVLVERFRAGDVSAFDELYRRHHPRLVRFVRRRVHERDAVEDLVHEAFAKALAALPTLRDPSRFYPWLTVIARNLVNRHRQLRGQVSPVAEVDTGWYEAPENELLRRIEHEDLQRALDRVRARHREILQMRERDELSYDDMARRLGTPITTIPPLLFRARQALRREYLAVTEDDPKLPAFGAGAVLALHRLRLRASRFTVWLPEASTLCATASCVVIGVGALVAGVGSGGAASADQPSQVAFEAGQPGSATVSGTEPVLTVTRGLMEVGHPPAPVASPPQSTVIGIAEWNRDRARHRQNRDRAREMPIYREVGPVWFSADPDAVRRDIESSLRGDTDWMEGAS